MTPLTLIAIGQKIAESYTVLRLGAHAWRSRTTPIQGDVEASLQPDLD